MVLKELYTFRRLHLISRIVVLMNSDLHLFGPWMWQEYDPDLPPELLAAANQQDGAGEFGFSQQRQPDSGTQSGAGRGRGGGRGRVTMVWTL